MVEGSIGFETEFCICIENMSEDDILLNRNILAMITTTLILAKWIQRYWATLLRKRLTLSCIFSLLLG